MASDDVASEDPRKTLANLPSDLTTQILTRLSVYDLGRLTRVSRYFQCSESRPLEEALRLKARAYGARTPAELPTNETSWSHLLSWALRRHRFHSTTTVAAGFLHGALIDNECRLFMLGVQYLECDDGSCEAHDGLLGVSDISDTLLCELPQPRLLMVLPRRPLVYAVSAGCYHKLLLTDCGIYSFGEMFAGCALGRGEPDKTNAGTPRKLQFVSDEDGSLWSPHITAISAGRSHSLFLRHDGRVYACGGSGMCGQPHERPYDRPVLVRGLQAAGIVAISAGGGHSLLLDSTGIVWSMGKNEHGALGLGGTALCRTATRERGVVRTALLPTPLELPERMRAVSAGLGHSLVLSDAGAVFSFGCGREGQLGHGTNDNDHTTPTHIEALRGVRIGAISAGASHSLAVDECHVVYAWGMRDSLGLPVASRLAAEDRADNEKEVAVLADEKEEESEGTEDDDSENGSSEQLSARPALMPRSGTVPMPIEVLHGKRITAVAAGHSQSLAISEEGEGGCRLFGWGSGSMPGVQGCRVPAQHTWPGGVPIDDVCGPGYAPMPPPPWWSGWQQP